MRSRLRVLPSIAVVAWLACGAAACSPGSTEGPVQPAAAPAEPAAPPAAADTTPVPEGQPAASDETTRMLPPVRGTVEIAYAGPTTVVKNNVVITTITVKNLSAGPIAGLKIEEFWWDSSNNPVTGDSERLTKPLQPGETATLTLETPKDPRMYRNTYQFKHAFGAVKTTRAKSLK